MNIYHLYHSGIAIEDSNNLFIFDYYNNQADGPEIGLSNGVIDKYDFKNYLNIYVFVSHRHSDHYNPIIFQWKKHNSNIKYILSDDIKVENGAEAGNIFLLKKGDKLSIDNVEITAYGSTDQGISFLVTFNGKTIFHAGDLNWWCWDNFSKEKLQVEEDDYKNELDKLKNFKIDTAFVPVDPRLGENYYLAGEYFINTLKPSLFIPIHFADNYKITEKFANRLFRSSTEVAIIKSRGEKIIY